MPGNKLSLSVIILAKNAEKIIGKAIESANFADEIIVINDFSTDSTRDISVKHGAKIIEPQSNTDFATKRTFGLKQAKHDWVFYLDADEVVTLDLSRQIQATIETNQIGAYKVNRQNYFLGTQMYPDTVDRLFHKSIIKGWSGAVHESPILTVEPKQLSESVLHHTHTDIASMLAKTNEWSEHEADLRIKANHPPVAWWRLIRIGITVMVDQIFNRKLYKFGRAGWFEAYFQMIDKLIVYTKLWERQQQRERVVE